MRFTPSVLREKALKTASRLPALSPTIGKLVFHTSSSDCEYSEIGELVERDPALSAEFIHLANSGMYARLRTITSVRHAIAMLGMGAVRRYAITHTVSRLFGRLKPASSFPLMLFNLHCTAVAALSEILARELPVRDRDSAFAAGLLHDFGRLLLAVTAPREYDIAMGLAAISDRSPLECEREVFGLDHVELTCAALDPWRVPEAVVNAIEYSHRPQADPSNDNRAVCLSEVICQADRFVNLSGVSLVPRRTGENEILLDFPGFQCDRESISNHFEKELTSLAAAVGYKGPLIRGPSSDPVVSEFLRYARGDQLTF